MVGTRGFEPPTSCSRSRRANQAALRPDPRAHLIKYLMIINPPTSRITKISVSRLRYFSIQLLICGPNTLNSPPTKKNLPARLTAEASIKIAKSILHAPAAMVNTLYGMGEKPAIPTASALYFM